MGDEKRTSRVGYGAGCVTIVLGLVLSVVAAIELTPSMLDDVETLQMPASHEVQFEHAGVHYLYHERRATLDGVAYVAPGRLNGMHFRVFQVDTGEEIVISPPDLALEYTTRERAGEAIARFSVPAPGRYRVVGTDIEGDDEFALIAVGPSIVGDILRIVLAVLGAMVFLTALGLGIIVRTYRKRRAQDHAVA